ncbi:prealbumin-like fold domain-containing protein [Protaetiibacter intestinalis]|uniref:SpaA-like prealbumin fold domain-containing protein n=1 Tax=Protaetiibacter intestinalis TaxID=2419774 RepID=A0A387BGL2_9MICO|nr:hypothetical protein [Protaetiibacter intestinalis]AYF97650.1 hypothetical protein D7I47_04835 [Protaetiibacter intestinalis]
MAFGRALRVATAGTAAVTLAVLPTIPAAAQIEPLADGSGLYITFVARVCDEYSDVMANKARNNIMESLRDLGPDSDYASNGIVTPDAEAAGSPDCEPLANWTLTMGTGMLGPATNPLSLSTVTGAYGTSIVTQASTALLDSSGQPTGDTIAGATTIELDATQAAHVQLGRQIWVQGGTPSAPLNNQQTSYGFAALRCAQDAVNGDNVEFVTYPLHQRHVFCYYYAVQPPPDPGTITIRKELADGEAGPVSFRFDGNLSYQDSNGDGVNDFTLTPNAGSPASVTFVRGAVGDGDPAWEVSEVVPEGWNDPGPPVCELDGSTVTTVDGVTSIYLASESNVVCTYTNSRVHLGDGSLWKETTGGVGDFPFTITGPGGFSRSDLAEVTEPGTAVEVATDIGIAAGTYTVTEELPAPTPAGSWELVSATCGEEDLTEAVQSDGNFRSVDVEVPDEGAAQCLWLNKFTPAGSITITKTTVGGVGAFPYAIDSLDADGAVVTQGRYSASATTTAEGTPVEAVVDSTSDPMTGIVVDPASYFQIQELLPAWSTEGHWHVLDIDCGVNQVSMDRLAASVVVELTTDDSQADCAFTNEWVPASDLTVRKLTTSDTGLRPGEAQLQLSCTEPDWPNGSDLFEFSVPVGESETEQAYTVMHGTVCRITEPETGAADDVRATTVTTVSVDGGPAVALASYDAEFTITPGTTVEVVIDNTLVKTEAEIAATGVDPLPWTLAGAFAVAGGVVLLLVVRRRLA